MKIFSGGTNRPLADKIAKLLNQQLGQLEIHVFADEEKRVRVADKVLGENAVVVQSTSINADKNYMELFFIVDGLKRNGAKSITCVIPYLGYQRQDHVFREGEAVSIDVISKILKTVGVDKIVTLDLHSSRIPEAFRIELVHLSALSIFASKIKAICKEGKDTVLVSPDRGGIRRIKILSKMLNGMSYAIIEKNRNLASGAISMDKVEGAIKRKAIIVDDMISTGATIVKAADLLNKEGAREIFVFATHPVFAGNAPKVLQKSVVKKIYVTDTIEVAEEKLFPKLNVLSVAGIVATSLSS